jgi:hypothetical protein
MADPTEKSSPNPLDPQFLFDQARSYLAFGEQISKLTEQFQNMPPTGADWGTVLRQNFDQFRAAVGESAEDPQVNPELARLWTQTLDMWQQTAASLGVVAPTEGDNAQWLDYRQVQNQYLDLLRQSVRSALDIMEQQLVERANSGQMIDTLRGLYNLWVDCNEKTYGQMLRGSQYSELSGQLFNSLLACYPKKGETPS